ncbi:MAG: DUF2442 domain-containing protein [Ardenticatenaceae bacterium]|nr:DUF2442 domain-containing protein [Anaerolineales bacterium]MCB8923062.1 DUF2442 domain-containing protein [Ardenticatenaceae bacterium]MCB8992073.1 DUF2442 domain-containing protein [Ardenticatenaceae bacterium]MCB9005690.1 DUF2442 domain-containing protein [Ardenticatenaceae bacterium]
MLGPRVKIQKATPLDKFVVLLEFADGTKKEVDLEPFLHGPIFAPIRDNHDFFRKLSIEGGTIAWPNGADMDPDVLYYNLTPAWMEETEPV